MKIKITKAKKLGALIALFVLLLSLAVIMAFANEDEIRSVGEMAGENGIYETFKPYLVQDTQKRYDEHVGSVQYTVYYDTAKGAVTTGEKGTVIAIYTVNHPAVERIGTDTNETIIQSMLDRGYAVVVLDYLENEKAKNPAIENSVMKFRVALKNGEILKANIFPSGEYVENIAVPSGYNVLMKQVFFEIDKHSTSGTLEKIVETWNADFKAVKGKKLVKWVYADGTRKTVATAFDGTEPTWHNADGSTNESGEYTYVKYTVAETITDCVNPDGSFIDLDYYMNIVYPTSPEKEVPVGIIASSSGNISCLSADRPQYIAPLYRGYAYAVYDFLWTPMARNSSFGYFDGTNGITGDHITYGVQQYNDKLYNTAAMRYLRYLSVNGENRYKFDIDKFFVLGNSKGGWYNFLGEEVMQSPIVSGDFATTLEKAITVDKALATITPYKFHAGKAGETRYQNQEGESTANGIVIAAGELQPWMLYEKDCTYDESIKAGDEIISGIQASHPSNGSQHEDITAGHTPIIIGSNMFDSYNAAYGYSNHVYNICKTLDIPLIHFEVPLGHTLISGPDLNYNVDTYEALFDFIAYFMKEEEIKVLYTLPLNNTGKVAVTDSITVKFAGIVSESEIAKVSVSCGDEVLTGSWSSLFGGTEWTFTPDCMKGNTEYTINVPRGLKGENGAVMKSDYTSTFITEFDKADTEITTLKTEGGTYYSFKAPALTTGNGFVFRFRADNDAANTVSLYAVDSTSAISGDLLGNVRVKGEGSYEIDVSDYIAKNSGKNVTLLLKADKAASETVVKEESFDTFCPRDTPSSSTPEKKLTLEAGASIDGRTALKVSLENAVIVKGVSKFYEKSNSIFSISNITGGIKTTNANNGRRFLVELEVYDTISRTVRFAINRMTNRVDFGTIDYDAIFLSVNTKANEWTHISFIYEMPDSDYGFVSNNRTQTLTFYAATDGVKGSPLYYDNMTVTEIVTDVDFGFAAVAETDNGLGAYKAPENMDMPISIYNYGTLIGNYSNWKSALAAYESGCTIKLNADYTLLDSHLSDLICSFEAVNVDLNGYTLTSSNTKNSLLWARATNATTTTVNIFNGSILLGRTPLASYESGSKSGKTLCVNITNVNFGFSNGAFITEMISASTGTDGVDQSASFSLEGCTFVLRDDERAKDGVVIFPGSFDGNLKLSYKLTGGSLYLDSQKWVTITDKAVALEFLKDEKGAYTPLYVSESMFTEFTTPLLSDKGYVIYTRGEDVGGNVVLYTLEVGEECTPYGIIPEEYMNSEKYPFVLFDGNGNFEGAFDKLYGNNDSAIVALRSLMRESNLWNAELGIHTGINPVILQRRDYTTNGESYYNWSQIPGEFTIDLGGFTFTHNASGSAIFDFESKAASFNGKYFYPTTANVINGTLVTKVSPFVRVKANESTDEAANSIADKKFTINFDGVTFSLSDGATVTNMMVGYRGTSNTDCFEEGKPAPFFLNFDDCIFDVKNRPEGDFAIFNSATTTEWIEMKMTVAGSKVIGEDMTGVDIFTANSTNGSSVTFLSNKKGKYISIESTDSAYSFGSVFTTDEGDKYLVQDSENKGNYTIAEYDETQDLKLPEGYDKEKYPFALFYDGEFIDGFTHFANVNSDASETGDYRDAIQAARGKVAGASSAGKTVYILLCRDYTLDSTEYALNKSGELKNELFYNWSQIGGTVVINLNGNELTMGNEVLVYAECKTNYNTEIVFKNGTINTKSKAVVQYRSTTGMTASKNFDVKFEKVSFVLSTTTGASIVGYSSNAMKSTVPAKAEINLINCTFDYSKAGAAVTMFDLSNTLLNVNVTVKGGKIVAGAAAFNNVTYAKLKTGNTVKFVADKSGNYTKLYMPKGDVTTKTLPTDTGDKYFVRIGVGEYGGNEYYVYAPGEKMFTEYTPKMSITLDNQLVMNVYIPVKGTQSFTFDGVTYKNLASLADRVVKIDENNYYRFSVVLASSEAAKDIVLRAVVGGDGASGVATFTFSVPKYSAKLISGGNDIEKTLAKDVLAYVRAAYNYEGFKSFNTAEEIARVNTLINSIIGDYEGIPVSSGVTNTVAPITAVTLNLDAKPSIRFYVTDTSIEFFTNGRKLNTVTGTDEVYGAYVELDVYAYALCETVTYGKDGSYHISDFIKGAVGTEYEAIVKAFVKYTESAADYRNSVIEGNK